MLPDCPCFRLRGAASSPSPPRVRGRCPLADILALSLVAVRIAQLSESAMSITFANIFLGSLHVPCYHCVYYVLVIVFVVS